jgi:hypothetical protein
VQEGVGLGIASWALGPAGAVPVTPGTDVALVEDGLITVMWTLLDA